MRLITKLGISVAIFLVVCSQGFASGGDESVESVVVGDLSTPVEVTIMMTHGGQFPEDEPIWTAVQEKLNFKIDWRLVHPTGYDQACSAMVASGDIPDWIKIQNNTVYADMLYAGMLRNLSEGFKKYGLAESVHYLNQPEALGFKEEDGYYRWPIKNNPVGTCYYARGDWMEELGLTWQDIQTWDDFTDMLRGFKENHPDAWPLLGGIGNHFDNFFTSWTGVGEIGYDNGQIVYYKAMDEYRDCLRWLKNLIDEKLLYPEFMTIGYHDTIKMYGLQEAAAYWQVGSDSNYRAYIDNLKDQFPDSEAWTEVILMPKSPKGVRAVAGDLPMNWYTVISSEPDELEFERILHLINFAITEEGIDLLTYGPDNSDGSYAYTYHTVDEKGVRHIDPNARRDAIGTRTYHHLGFMVDHSRRYLSWTWEPMMQKALTRHAEDVAKIAVSNPVKYMYDERTREIQPSMKEIIEKYEIPFIMGGRDIDSEWDAYIKELKAVGLEEYLEICDQWLKENPDWIF